MVIEGKLAIGLLCVLLGVALTSYSRLTRASESNFRFTILGIWLFTRIGLFIAIYGLMGIDPQSDVMGYYLPQGKAAMRGLLVYRDFSTSYAPIFPYVVASAMKWVWASPKMIVLLAILADGVSLPLWMGATARLLPMVDARRAALLYVANATPLVNVVFEGQNQAWVAAFLAAAAWLYARGRVRLTAVVLSIPVVLVKFLSLLTVPAFIFWSKKRIAFAGAFAVLPLLVYGTLLAKGVDILVPLKIEGTDRTSGSLPFLATSVLNSFGVAVSPRVYDAITVLALGVLVLWFLRQNPRLPPAAALWALVMTMMTLLLFSKKAYTAYLVLVFFPICALVASRTSDWLKSAAFGVFGAVAMIERTLWFRWLGARQLPEFTQHPVGARLSLHVVTFVFVDLVLLAFYGWLWYLARAQLRSLSADPLRSSVAASREQ